MNNEPVAWMNSKGDIILPAMQANKEYNIPLYTHPVKKLTDEEITEIFRASSDHIEFARAVLEKASEK